MLEKIVEANDLNQIKTTMVKKCGTAIRTDVYGVRSGENASTCEGLSGKVAIDIEYPLLNDRLPVGGWWNFKWQESLNGVTASTRIIEYSTDYDSADESAATWTRVDAGGNLTDNGNGSFEYIGEGDNGSAVAVAIPTGLKAVRVRINDGSNDYYTILPLTSAALVQEVAEDFDGVNGTEYELTTDLTQNDTGFAIQYVRGPLVIDTNKGVADTNADYGAGFLVRHSGTRFFSTVDVNLENTALSEGTTATKRITGLFLNGKLDSTWFKNNSRAGLKRNAATRLFAYERFDGDITNINVTATVDLTTTYVVKMFTNESGTFAAVFTSGNAFIAGIADWGNNNRHSGMGPIANNDGSVNDYTGYKF